MHKPTIRIAVEKKIYSMKKNKIEENIVYD